MVPSQTEAIEKLYFLSFRTSISTRSRKRCELTIYCSRVRRSRQAKYATVFASISSFSPITKQLACRSNSKFHRSWWIASGIRTCVKRHSMLKTANRTSAACSIIVQKFATAEAHGTSVAICKPGAVDVKRGQLDGPFLLFSRK